MNSFCSVVGHQNNKLDFICLNQNCNSQLKCCTQCISSIHLNHQSECLKVLSLDDFLETQYIELHQKIKLNIQQLLTQLDEKFSNTINCVKKNFLTFNDDIQDRECMKIRKQQISFILRQKQILEESIIKVKSQLIEQQPKLDIIVEELEKSQKEIHKIKLKYSQQQAYQKSSSDQLNQKNTIQIQSIPSNNNQKSGIPKKKVIILDDDSFEDQEYLVDNVQDIKTNSDLLQSFQVQEENYFFQENFEDQVIDYSVYEQLKQQLKLSNKKYSDIENNRIFNDSKILRISDMFKNFHQFFANPQGQNVFAKDGLKVRLSDVIIPEQKDFFDYLVYYLACFCPKQLQKLFITTEINYNGLYAVKMKNGKYYDEETNFFVQIVDDFIPILSESTLKNINQICFLILRKAVAKYQKSYKFFNKFQYLLTLSSIFFTAVVSLKLDENNLVEMLQNEINCKSFILTSIKPKNIWNDKIKVVQIVKIFPVTTILNEQIYLVKIRSGYKDEFYQEEWTYDSPLWTDELFKTLEVDLEDDGIIYIEFMNLIQQVGLFYSIRLNSRLLIQENAFLRNNQSSYFQLDVQQDDNFAISIYIEDNQICIGHQYFQILISELNTNNFVSSKYINRSFSTQQFLKKGKYVIFIKCPFMTNSQKQAIIYIYGQYPIKLQKIQKIENYKQLVFDNQIEKVGKVLKTSGNMKILKLDYVENGWKVYKFLNLSQQKQEIQFICPLSDQVRLCKPFQSKQVIKFLSYNESFIIIMKIYEEQNREQEIFIQNKRITF